MFFLKCSGNIGINARSSVYFTSPLYTKVKILFQPITIVLKRPVHRTHRMVIGCPVTYHLHLSPITVRQNQNRHTNRSPRTNRSINRGYIPFPTVKPVFPRQETLVSSAWNCSFQPLKLKFPRLGTKCFITWNEVFQALGTLYSTIWCNQPLCTKQTIGKHQRIPERSEWRL